MEFQWYLVVSPCASISNWCGTDKSPKNRGRRNEIGNEYFDGDIVVNIESADGVDINRDGGESTLIDGPNDSVRDTHK